MEALFEHVWMRHPPLRFLILEPLSEREADGMIARDLLVLVAFHPIEITVETIEESVGQP